MSFRKLLRLESSSCGKPTVDLSSWTFPKKYSKPPSAQIMWSPSDSQGTHPYIQSTLLLRQRLRWQIRSRRYQRSNGAKGGRIFCQAQHQDQGCGRRIKAYHRPYINRRCLHLGFRKEKCQLADESIYKSLRTDWSWLRHSLCYHSPNQGEKTWRTNNSKNHSRPQFLHCLQWQKWSL